MEKIKKFLADKCVGFYLSVAMTLLALIAMICLFAFSGGSKYFSVFSMISIIIVFLCGAAFVSIASLKIKLNPLIIYISKIVAAVISLAAICFFILQAYTVLISELTLLDSSKLVGPLVTMLLMFLVSNVNVYHNQLKTSVDTASVDTASVDTASVDTASVDTASVDTASVDTASQKEAE